MVYRARLRRKTGCLRCKQRRAKCDEQKPVCSFCMRWRLECTWPVIPKPQSGVISRNRPVVPVVQQWQHSPLSKPTATVACIDPFHHFPLSNVSGQPLGPGLIRDFLTSAANANFASDGVQSQSPMIAGWLESAILDEAACCALITYWAKCSMNHSPKPKVKTLGLEFEGRTLSLLRRQIESGGLVTEETLLAAAVHFIAAALDLTDKREARKMLIGINALVEALGGVGQVMSTMKASTNLSVLTSDIFNSMLNADPHFFVNLSKPDIPDSFTQIYKNTVRSLDLDQFLREDVVNVLNDIDLLLFFRHPSKQTRSLSAAEAQYMSALGQWVDFQLGVLQSRHVGTRSVSEIVIVALIVVKQEVVADGAEHSILIATLLDRLRKAILFCRVKDHQAYQTLSMWASLVSLVGSISCPERRFFFTFIQSILLERYGETTRWPRTWEVEVGIELQQVLWHTRIAVQYFRTCLELGDEASSRVSEL